MITRSQRRKMSHCLCTSASLYVEKIDAAYITSINVITYVHV